MNENEIAKAIEKIVEQLGNEAFLNELLSALNNIELIENLEHIARMWDIDIS